MNTLTPIQLTNDRYRLGYHVAAPAGWINDPNGFCFFKGYYHIFYQHYPYGAQWGPMHWGHARSQDLIHWETLPIALTPGDPEDKDGCFSGSAIVKDDKLYLIYTGHHYYPGEDDPDHFWQNQNMAYSEDGIHFTKYANNPIIAAPPADNTHHFRDPKVWQVKDTYYMVLGSQAQTGLGRVILYQSMDLKTWTYLGPLAQAKDLTQEGFMWECPDFFNLAGQDILLTSPQGIQAQGKHYLNLYQTGYFVGQWSPQTHQFDHTHFKELDAGHDFYATQTTLAPDGRRLVFGWLDMWESNLPEQADGWAGALTLPRELTLKDDHLYMKPVAEAVNLRESTLQEGQLTTSTTPTTLSADLSQAELKLDLDLTVFQDQNFDLTFENQQHQSVLNLHFEGATNEITLTNKNHATPRYATLQKNDQLHLRLFIDTSSAEFFFNQGEVVFSERFYTETAPKISLTSSKTATFDSVLYKLMAQTITFS